MQTQVRETVFYAQEEERAYHDAHIKAYEAQNLGVKVIFCNANGVPSSDSIAPLSSYLPNTCYNM